MLNYILVVYSTYMKVKKIGGVLLFFLILTISTGKIYASDATFSLYPSSGVVRDVNDGFTVDILINSGENEVSKARAVIKFDPKIVKLSKAYRNNNLFEQWVENEISTDNVKGIVMLTAATTSIETIPYYVTEGDPDVFARLEFDIVTTDYTKPVILDFNYSGEDEELMSVILSANDGNVLNSRPLSATFTLGDGVDIPDTAIDMNIIGVVMGILLILAGGFIRSSRVDPFRRKRGTVVLFD